jgi:RimJ/RimL family protein N-acetyltransferase
MPDALPTLYTERLVLRPFAVADATEVQCLAGSRAIADTTLRIPHPYPEGAAEEWIRSHAPGYAAGTQATFALAPLFGGVILGCVGLVIDADNGTAELGYWVGEPYWGRGYATEGSWALLEFAFGELALHRIHAAHLVRNPASGRVMQKLGMKLEGIHRHGVRKWGVYEDVAHYARLATDQPATSVRTLTL